LVKIGSIAELTLDIARSSYPLPKETALASIPAYYRPTYQLTSPCVVRNTASGLIRFSWVTITTDGAVSISHNSTDSENLNELKLHLVYFIGN
jgi:hypothetical protein